MIKDYKGATVTRVSCHEVTWGKRGIVTSVTVGLEIEDEGNEGRHIPIIDLTVEYSGHPRHKVGDTFPAMADAVLLAMGIVNR